MRSPGCRMTAPSLSCSADLRRGCTLLDARGAGSYSSQRAASAPSMAIALASRRPGMTTIFARLVGLFDLDPTGNFRDRCLALRLTRLEQLDQVLPRRVPRRDRAASPGRGAAGDASPRPRPARSAPRRSTPRWPAAGRSISRSCWRPGRPSSRRATSRGDLVEHHRDRADAAGERTGGGSGSASMVQGTYSVWALEWERHDRPRDPP